LKIAWLCFICGVMKLQFMDKKYDFCGFGLKWRNWIGNPNPKSDFEYGLSNTIQSTKLDCNPNWTIQQFPVCLIGLFDSLSYRCVHLFPHTPKALCLVCLMVHPDLILVAQTNVISLKAWHLLKVTTLF